jgi:hypothetical protein
MSISLPNEYFFLYLNIQPPIHQEEYLKNSRGHPMLRKLRSTVLPLNGDIVLWVSIKDQNCTQEICSEGSTVNIYFIPLQGLKVSYMSIGT